MTWHETHLRLQALREVEALANAVPDGSLPWNDRYDDIFGTRESLVAALRYRWRLTLQAQLDSQLPESYLDERRRELSTQHVGVLRILDHALEDDLVRAS